MERVKRGDKLLVWLRFLGIGVSWVGRNFEKAGIVRVEVEVVYLVC